MKNMTKEQLIKKLTEERDLAVKQLNSIGLELGDKTDRVKAAVEKQTPKKVVEMNENGDGDFYWLAFMCPTCDNAVIGQPYRPNNCKHCGQALDWGE